MGKKMYFQVSKYSNCIFIFFFSVVKILCFNKVSLTLADLQEVQNSAVTVASFQYCIMLYHIGVAREGLGKS